jgi:hypothetical protein
LNKNYEIGRLRSKDALSHVGELPVRVTQKDFAMRDHPFNMVYLDGDRLYTEVDDNLKVYLINNMEKPIACYKLNGESFSCLVTENRLYINGSKHGVTILHIFEVSTSLTQPLNYVN